MATTKDQFIQDATNEIVNFPNISRRFQIGDPLITQGLAAMAAMLADLSNQVELTAGEVYLKARDSTVLADAAAKGVLPFATPSIARIGVKNAGSSPVSVLVGRVLIDQAGRFWLVTLGGTVAAGATAYIFAKQVSLRQVAHTVSQYEPFYTVDLAEPDIGYIAEVAVKDFQYTPEYCNVLAGDAIYHIKCDENQAMSLMFGVEGVAGRQLAAGTNLSISIYDTEGTIAVSVGMTFSFEYTNAGDELVTLTVAEVSQAGAAPMDMVTMRETCSYPGIYNANAVYRSNFDFLVRRHVTPLNFLSVWNEAREEVVRGPGVQIINTLFVAAKRDGTNDATLQAEIAKVILGADNSYKIKAVPVIEIEEPLAITLYIPSTYDAASIIQAVRALVLANYGRESAWAKRGEAQILRKDLYDLFRENVPALTQRIADASIDTIGSGADPKPEHFRYVTEASLVVTAKEAE